MACDGLAGASKVLTDGLKTVGIIQNDSPAFVGILVGGVAQRSLVRRASQPEAERVEGKAAGRVVVPKNQTDPLSDERIRLDRTNERPAIRPAFAVVVSVQRSERAAKVQGNHRVTIGLQTRPIMAGDSRP